VTKPKPATPTVRTCETCGHEGRYSTIDLADHHFPRHSCELVVQRRERASRRLARLEAAGPERPCTCKKADHQHGNLSRYRIDGCRCLRCRRANSQQEADRKRDVLYGRTLRVDAEPARQHVRRLMSQGMGIRRVAQVAGVAHSTIAKLLYGARPTKKLERGVAAKILAVRLDLAPGARVSAVGASRRLQALVTLGWSQAKLADALGVGKQNLTGLIHGTRGLTVVTATRVAALYDDLWDQQPPRTTRYELNAYSRATRYARTHGWLPPQAWDDDTIDHPSTEPDLAALPTATTERRRVDVDEVEFLTDQDVTRTAIAEQLDTTVDLIRSALIRAGRHDLWVRLCARDGVRIAPLTQAAA